ncbi:hypothetical protein LB503_003658 [Fusarium chuoi]|nr:hypothetical protein LB503_003658 [Fusarium chuoi]
MSRQIPARGQYFFDDRALSTFVALKPIPPACSQLYRAVPPGRKCLFPVSSGWSSSSLPGYRRPFSTGFQISNFSCLFSFGSPSPLVISSPLYKQRQRHELGWTDYDIRRRQALSSIADRVGTDCCRQQLIYDGDGTSLSPFTSHPRPPAPWSPDQYSRTVRSCHARV